MSAPRLRVLEGATPPERVGRYLLHRPIARGGMATIHLARLLGEGGFQRLVAVKRLHPEFAEDDEFVAMFLNEARVASRVRHRNVVPVLDVVRAGDEVMLVQEYVHGVPLAWLARTMSQAGRLLPVEVAVSIACQTLLGLHAAHETVDELGHALQIVHRDVSPQNVLVATDGSARLLDFGVAKASMAAHVTRAGTYKGKLAYSAPEQLRGAATRQSDLFSLSVVLWELLVGRRMHGAGTSAPELVVAVLNGNIPSLEDALLAQVQPAAHEPARRAQVEAVAWVIERGLAPDLRTRWATAAQMEQALARAIAPLPPSAIARWLEREGRAFLDARTEVLAAEEALYRSMEARAPAAPAPRAPDASGVARRPVHAPRCASPASPVAGVIARALLHRRRGLLALACVAAVALGLSLGLALAPARVATGPLKPARMVQLPSRPTSAADAAIPGSRPARARRHPEPSVGVPTGAETNRAPARPL